MFASILDIHNNFMVCAQAGVVKSALDRNLKHLKRPQAAYVI